MKILGLIKILDIKAYDIYRSKVGDTVTQYGGSIVFRGKKETFLWNELACGDFDSVVQLEFAKSEQVIQWASSVEYRDLLQIRASAMAVTLFSISDKP